MSTHHEPGTLGWWLDERRGELGLTWDEVAERAGVAPQTVYRIISGSPMRTTTRKGLERALHWAAGSIIAILAGGEPTPTEQPEPDPADEVTELREMAQNLQVRAAEAQALAQQLMERLDRMGQSGEHRAAQ